MKRKLSKYELKNIILLNLKKKGFLINPHLRPANTSKNFLKKLHEERRLEILMKYRKFIEDAYPLIKDIYDNSIEIEPEKIKLKLLFIERDDEEFIIFKWFSLVWWSLPYEKTIGRVVRYLVFDKTHKLPFGLVQLQSPILRCEARDKFLGIHPSERDYWINQSLHAQRVGALPPYHLIGGNKLMAMTLVLKEINDYYRKKYKNKKSVIRKRFLPARILFTSTFSAFGRSPMYEDIFVYLNRKKIKLSYFVGFTKGSGSFHIPEYLLNEIEKNLGKKYKENKGEKRSMPTFSYKIRKISYYAKLLGIPYLSYHNIKRGIYIFPLVKNLKECIQKNEKPRWLNIDFKKIEKEWSLRYLQNSQSIPKSLEFSLEKFIKNDRTIKKYFSFI